MAHWRTSPEREALVEVHNSLVDQVEQAEQRLDQLIEAAESEIRPLAAQADTIVDRIDETDRPLTATQWLEMRAAQADRDLASSRHDVAAAEAAAQLDRALAELAQVGVRIGQLDHVLESGAVTAGNDDQMAILMLDLQEASLREGLAVAAADLARRRLAHIERMHQDIHAALEKQRQPTKARRAKGS